VPEDTPLRKAMHESSDMEKVNDLGYLAMTQSAFILFTDLVVLSLPHDGLG